MARAVLISIRPGWTELIACGDKTLEIRKTRPNLETPFKCYIYCTKEKDITDRLWVLNKKVRNQYLGLTCITANLGRSKNHSLGNRKVVGEFVCDRINLLTHVGYSGSSEKPVLRAYKADSPVELEPNFDFSATCMSTEKTEQYLDGGDGYAWHISKLEIYDTPKPLSAFEGQCKIEANCWVCPYYNYTKMVCDGRTIKRPPQSWRYVEELKNG